MNQNPNQMFQQVISPVKNELSSFKKEYSSQFNGEINTLISNYRPAQGKHLRPILFFLIQGLFHPPKKESVPLAVMVEIIHDASLVHDDVIDESELRRGIETMHVANGKHLAVLFGDYLFAHALNLGACYNNAKVIELISEAVLSMTKGAVRELTQTFNPDKKLYLKIIKEKTADFFRIVCEVAGIVQEVDTNNIAALKTFGENFGMAFQIHDDILDYSGSSELLKKPVNHDLTNGILTLPLIIALEESTSKIRKEVLGKIKNDNPHNFEWLQTFILDKKGLDKASQMADDYMNQASEILEGYDESVYKKSLKLLMEYEQCRLS